MRMVEVIAPERYAKELIGMAKFYGADDCWWGALGADGRQTLYMLVPDKARQSLLDSMQSMLDREPSMRIVVTAVTATLPRTEEGDEESRQNKRNTVVSTREELYTDIAKGAQLDRNFLLLVVLSTIVAAIGLVSDNVAVIIGAMVIAPLLGPIMAFAFATSLGDRGLAKQALTANAAGLGLAIALSVLISILWADISLDGHEVLSRTHIEIDSVVLALASGAAAALSITTGLSSTLVGVMVAVALLPPAAVMGMMFGQGQWILSAGAGMILMVNIVSVLLSAKVVFFLKGIKPRGWLETARVKNSMVLYIGLWATLIVLLSVGIFLSDVLNETFHEAIKTINGGWFYF